jgi:hypothetical protein
MLPTQRDYPSALWPKLDTVARKKLKESKEVLKYYKAERSGFRDSSNPSRIFARKTRSSVAGRAGDSRVSKDTKGA